jgi:hypothetical protein
MRHLLLVAFLAILFGTGCASKSTRIVDKNSPTVDLITKCTAGILSHYDAGGTFKTDLDKAITKGQIDISIGAEVNEWVHGYMFEKIPSDQALEAYKLYLDCVKEEGGGNAQNQ